MDIVFASAGLIVLIAVLLVLVASRYRVAGPNEAFVVTGRNKSGENLAGPKVVVSGGVFLIPFVQRLSKLDLSSRSIGLSVEKAASLNNIQIDVQAVAMVKVGGDEDSIRAAAQRFQGQQASIEQKATEVLNGALRSVIGTMSVEQIIRDRNTFTAKVIEVTAAELTDQGLKLDTLQIKDVDDGGSGYLKDLGRPEAARVKQAADIAEAEAKRTSEQARLAAQQDIIDAQRDFDLRAAGIQAETEAAKAKADAAGPLAQAAKNQEILTAQELVAEKQAALKDRQLDTEVRKPADAARYQAEQEAEAARVATVKQAEAEAQRQKLTGEGERLRRAALAEAIRLEGEAEAAATLAKGSAEAQAMQKRADAFKQYGQAAVTQMLVEKLPQIAHELAAPMGSIDKLTVISTDGAGALPKAVAGNMAQLTQLVKDTTGLDVTEILSSFTGGKSDDAENDVSANGKVLTD